MFMLGSAPGHAQVAPGEDPVHINGKVSYLQMPTAPRSVSASIVYRTGMPDDAKAKIAHYVAKAYSANTDNVKTNKDVVSSVQTNSMGGTTCVQTVQPTAQGSGGVMGQDQVVVIRGDLVNICR
jgi:hypothetical protein